MFYIKTKIREQIRNSKAIRAKASELITKTSRNEWFRENAKVHFDKARAASNLIIRKCALFFRPFIIFLVPPDTNFRFVRFPLYTFRNKHTQIHIQGIFRTKVEWKSGTFG